MGGLVRGCRERASIPARAGGRYARSRALANGGGKAAEDFSYHGVGHPYGKADTVTDQERDTQAAQEELQRAYLLPFVREAARARREAIGAAHQYVTDRDAWIDREARALSQRSILSYAKARAFIAGEWARLETEREIGPAVRKLALGYDEAGLLSRVNGRLSGQRVAGNRRERRRRR